MWVPGVKPRLLEDYQVGLTNGPTLYPHTSYFKNSKTNVSKTFIKETALCYYSQSSLL